MLPTWADICSCNICIHHIPVDYVGKGREHDMDAGGRATHGTVVEERELCSVLLPLLKLVDQTPLFFVGLMILAAKVE